MFLQAEGVKGCRGLHTRQNHKKTSNNTAKVHWKLYVHILAYNMLTKCVPVSLTQLNLEFDEESFVFQFTT